jgi:hypothetical protein
MTEIVNCYPVGIQTFEEIRNKGYLYVDKTKYIVDFRKKMMKYVFLSRPRRFGKSLFASTLQAYFEGRKELFEGLAIADYEKEWVAHPVLHFDLSGAKHMDAESLKRYLLDMLDEHEAVYGYKSEKIDPNIRLKDLVKRANEQTGQKAVVIIDEYDAPLLDVVHEKENLQELRRIMQNFYSPLKMLDPYLEFTFLTGITKFSQLSIFSELNNLDNISMYDQYSAICGISLKELTTVMKPDVEGLGRALGLPYEECLEELCQHYGGYHFCSNLEEVLSPYSLFRAMSKKNLDLSPEEKPAYIENLLRNNKFNMCELDDIVMCSYDMEEPFDVTISPLPLLYRYGYLAIKDYDTISNSYDVGFPNIEVKNDFVHEATSAPSLTG